MLWDGTYGFLSLSEKTRKSNRLQMSLQRQHFLPSYLKSLSVGPAGVRTRDLPLNRPALSQLSQPGGGIPIFFVSETWIPGFQSLVEFRILWVIFRIPKPRIKDSTRKNFRDSGSEFLYLGRYFWCLFCVCALAVDDTCEYIINESSNQLSMCSAMFVYSL